VCASTALLVSGVPAFAAPPPGQVGIVDLDGTAAGTQGAPAVTPGTSRALADVQLLVPNDYVANDTITLGLVDSGASDTNLNAASTLAFSALPNVTVSATPFTSASHIGPTAAATSLVPDGAPAAGTTPPTFTKTLKDSGRAHGKNDAVELKVGAAAGGTTTDFWLVTVSNIKVDVGVNVDPGELRVVPVGSDFPGNTVASPVAGQYTVGGFVTPASVSVADPSGITADGTTQGVGDITVAELVNRGLNGTATYTITVPSSVTVHNDTGSNKVTATLSGPANGETVSAVTPAAHSLTFTLTQTDVASSAANLTSVKLHGLLLSSSTNTTITYTLSGGSVDDAVAVDPTANQTDIESPGLPKATGTSVTADNRISGADRYATAAQIALRNGGGGTVVLASGVSFPDALSAGFLSQRLGGVSVLLTQPNALPSATESALRQLDTTRVYVIGGTSAISAGVFDAVKAITEDNANIFQTPLVTRLSGADRYATNKAVNTAASNIGSSGIGTTTITFGQASKKTAIMATGENFADALAATPATAGAGNGALPLILTQSATLSQAAKDQLNAFDIKQVVIAGGTTAVSSSVESSLTGMGIAVKRIAGATRYETATALAAFEMDDPTPTGASDEGGLGFTPFTDEAFLATGEAFADALAGGPLAANLESPILLTTGSSLQSATQAFLEAHNADFDTVTALGGPVAIANAVVQAANTAVIG
jgi:putative cell wall-binding protein